MLLWFPGDPPVLYIALGGNVCLGILAVWATSGRFRLTESALYSIRPFQHPTAILIHEIDALDGGMYGVVKVISGSRTIYLSYGIHNRDVLLGQLMQAYEKTTD